ncbi:hypothetical protein [Nocardia brasiliensis]|nr:hypothetical protein [Nocardia brasiliensis]
MTRTPARGWAAGRLTRLSAADQAETPTRRRERAEARRAEFLR